MRYDDVIKKMSPDTVYSRQQIYEIMQAAMPGLSANSFKWIIHTIVKNGEMVKKQRNAYLRPSVVTKEKYIYQPTFDAKATGLIQKLERRFPYVAFTCFESVHMNEFLNHLIGQNTYYLMTEREVLESIFRFLQEEEGGIILLKPGLKEWDAYWSRGCVVLLPLISESPKNSKIPHGMNLEKLLVDLIAEKTMQILYSKSELPRIYKSASENYQIDLVRLMRYARRRGKADEIRNYLGEIIDVDAGKLYKEEHIPSKCYEWE